MAVPIGMVELHKPHPPLNQPPGQQTIAGEGGLLFLDAIQLAEWPRSLRERSMSSGALRLHAVGHFIGGDACFNFGIAGLHQALQI